MNRRIRKSLAFLLLLVACAAQHAGRHPSTETPPPRTVTLSTLTPHAASFGFVATSRYVDGDVRPRGARFVHAKTGFVFDYLQIESAPQAFLYVTTYPTSDRGEPHTQEHLLLGRGNAGRFLGNFEHTNLARSSAFTAQFRTAYHFHTGAGTEAFWGVLRTELQALLRPDYSDEEIRREVRDFGIARDPSGKLSIDEKGTVYNEMVRTFESPETRLWYEMRRALYGPGHPLGSSSGGTPEGIRELGPEEIRRFHAAHYRLDNMGMVAAFPSALALDDLLSRLSQVLDGFAPTAPPPQRLLKEGDLPRPRGAPAGELAVVDYPFATEDHPGSELFAWPATRDLSLDDRVLLQLFLSAFAGGGGSTLYRALVDEKTKTLDVGATAVWAWVCPEQGQPVYLGVTNARAGRANTETLSAVRDTIRAELDRIVELPDGSPELREFAERVVARATEERRWSDKMLDTPPEFGVRGTTDAWIDLLTDVQGDSAGFDKSLVRKRALEAAAVTARGEKNPWRERIPAWGLLARPYGKAARASPALRKRLEEERAARCAAESARLTKAHGARSEEEALERRKREIDEADAEVARAEAAVAMPPLVASPPLTEDDLLAFRTEVVRGVPVVTSTIDTMKSATFGLALRLDRVPDELLPYLAILPALVRDVGVARDGVSIPYDEVRDRLRREVLSLNAYLSTSFPERRAELVLEASGNDEAETKRALGWLREFLVSSDLRTSNLPRIRDVVAESAADLHDVMSGREEAWVRPTEEAFGGQDSPLLLHTGCALTRAYDAYILGWRLSGAGPTFAAELERLADAPIQSGTARAALDTLTHELGAKPGQAYGKAARELAQLLADVPDEALSQDWAGLCRDIADGARADPEAALQRLREAIGHATHAGNARGWFVGSSQHQRAVAPDVDELLSTLDPAPQPRVSFSGSPHVLERARARGADVSDPRYVALVNSSTSTTSLSSTAPLPASDAQGDDALVDYLASNVFNGTGSHSFYKRIWGAGLAYSGYAWSSPRVRRYGIYTDRCADLPQLLRLLARIARDTPDDPRFVSYALARAFTSRVADSYEARARAIATDIADGYPPERVRAFRKHLLSLQARPGLSSRLRERLEPMLSAVLPSLPLHAPASGAVSLAVGPAPLLDAYERELQASQGPQARLLRIYPRDFWFVGSLGSAAGRRPSPPAVPPSSPSLSR